VGHISVDDSEYSEINGYRLDQADQFISGETPSDGSLEVEAGTEGFEAGFRNPFDRYNPLTPPLEMSLKEVKERIAQIITDAETEAAKLIQDKTDKR
jgi:hypothetical protein